MQQNKSEVARLMASIEAEYEAGKRGLVGLSEGSARHEFISAHMDRLWAYKEELGEQVGEQEATALLCQVFLDGAPAATDTLAIGQGTEGE